MIFLLDDAYTPLTKALRKPSEPLPDNWEIPLTTQRSSYRSTELSKKYMDISPCKPLKPEATNKIEGKS